MSTKFGKVGSTPPGLNIPSRRVATRATQPIAPTPPPPSSETAPVPIGAESKREEQTREALGFERMRTITNLFNDAELDDLIALARDNVEPASISGGEKNDTIRRSEVHWLRRSDGHGWIYDRIWKAITGLNETVFHFDITGFQTSVQLTRYDSSNRGFYTWHMDTGAKTATRKLSFTVQVSPPDAYHGGNLELFYRGRADAAPRDRGSITVFPSFVMHRVTPVKKGTRYSLVAWIEGPRWR